MAAASGTSEEETRVSSGDNIHPRLDVYIWDMDETLILLNSLLKSSYAEAFNGLKDVQKGVELGKMWENLILQLCDDHFFYEQVRFGFLVQVFSMACFLLWRVSLMWGVFVLQIESYNKPFLDVLSKYDDGKDLSDYDFNQDELGPPLDDANKRKLAYRHRIIAKKYLQVKLLELIQLSATVLRFMFF